jgi:hypothetical protein
MKKILATTALMTLVSTPVLAAKTGTLLLQGTVDEVLSLTVDAVVGVHDKLDLSASPTNLQVATVNENSNSETGYVIEVKSDNAGKLQNGTLDSVSYTMTYGSSGPITLTSSYQDAKVVSTGGVYNTSEDVSISYAGKPAEQLVQGTYSDVVTFSIKAK